MPTTINLNNFRMTNTEFQSGIAIVEYKGKWSVTSARHSKNNDKIYQDWCFLAKWNQYHKCSEPSERSMPLQINLGSREDAIGILTHFLKILGVPAAENPIPF